MIAATTPRIRNVALVGHSGSGKTTLAEALLLRAGVITRAGRVEDGSTVCDFEAEEIKHAISISLAVAPFEWTATDGETYKVNLIDTPGYADFAAGVDAALSVADLAVLVVSAVDGVEVGTEAVWAQCVAAGLPRMVFVTKEDKARADFRRVLEQLRVTFGPGFAPLELPLGEEESFRGVADVLSGRGYAYDADGHQHSAGIPTAVEAEEERLHAELAEEIVAGDDEQLERYLAGETPSAADLERALAHEVRDGLEFPVLVGSAATGVGVDRLADFICEIGPSPADRATTVRVGDAAIPVTADPAGDPLAYVFRTVVDPFVGQVCLFKVLSGTIRAEDHLVNTTTQADERLHGLFYPRGKDHLPADVVVAGDIAAVAKLAASPTGSALALRSTPVLVAGPAPRSTPYGLALRPLTQADDDKLSGALARLCAEDPSLVVERTAQPSQTVLRGIGDTHVAVALERLARKFGVNVETEPIAIGFRETIAGPADVEGKVKKQSGGHGQYAVTQLRISPAELGRGSEFVDSVVGGAIPRNYIPAVERGVTEAMDAGGLHGFPVVDVRVEVYDGKYHSVDSSDMAFRTAGAHGLREALRTAGTVVLEPVASLTVTVPVGFQGDVLGDLSARRGRILSTSATADGRQVIEAMVPEAELTRYVLELRSLTGGRGEFAATPHHYAALPAALVAKVTAPPLTTS
ncbi:elongation factor G [Pengzhenrongella sicca]|uniref:Elongation factor G n=1 Tax=Pengzhenrongella sicca TaxID=2819238 RepID=A0A8A4ZGG7_9MICO|nr:elongation factor G [Pengzhenrongella sicca]QTE29577.1 elongation factor G [Pengzhenrongella sicca]